jgi:hypothetical protein
MRMRATIVAAWLAIAPALAQTPAPTPTVSPEARAAAKELIEVMQATDQFKKVLPVIMQQLKPLIVQGRPEIARDFDLSMPAVIDAMTAKFGDLADSIGMIYALHFTADEMRQMTAFYRTPVGQKFVEKMPAITQQSFAVGQKFGEQIAGDLRQTMIEQLRKRGHNI